MSPSGCHGNLDHQVPLIIGSIPLREHFTMFRPAAPLQPQPLPSSSYPTPMPPSAPSGPIGATAPPAGFNVSPYNPNIPPTQPGYVAPTAPVFPGVLHYPDLREYLGLGMLPQFSQDIWLSNKYTCNEDTSFKLLVMNTIRIFKRYFL